MVEHGEVPNRLEFAGSNPSVKAVELFPELSDDIDRRIAHAETRLKFWVIGGVLCNLLAGLSVGIPMVYYLGKMDTRFTEVIERSTTNELANANQDSWMREREIWENEVEEFLVTQGFIPPRYGRPRSES